MVDKDGIIRYRCVSPQLDQIPDIYELFDQLEKLEPQAGATGAR